MSFNNLLARLTANVWHNNNFEELTMDIDITQGNEVLFFFHAHIFISLKILKKLQLCDMTLNLTLIFILIVLFYSTLRYGI